MPSEQASSNSRRRRPFIAAGVVITLLVIWAAAGWRTVPEGAVGLRDSRLRADRVLEPGGHLILPGLDRLTILDPYSSHTKLAWTSPVGSRLEFEFSASLRLTPVGARTLVASSDESNLVQGLSVAIDALALSVIQAAPRVDGIPDLGAQTDAELIERLSEYGALDGEPVLRYDLDSPVIYAMLEDRARRRVRELAVETGQRILVVGLDGADWQIAEPLIDQGRLPHLASLRRRGSWGNIKALTPILSPLIWTSIATGVTADRHGILDFLVKDTSSGQKVPVNSRFRKVRALWNIFSDAERSADFVAWWATWPSEIVNGHMISDRVSYSLFDVSVPDEGAGLTHPPSYLFEIGDKLIGDDAITYDEVARFADVTREEFEAERALIEANPTEAYKRPLNHLTKILAATRNYHTIALDLLQRGPSDLTAVYYQGIDEVGHRFMHYAPPRTEGVSAEEYGRFSGVVEEFYVYQDELLGELLRLAGSETTVLVLSDHGFLNGPDRPQGQTADIEGQPARWHRRYGVLVLAGPPIARRKLDTTSMLDITPTVLRLAGLPVAEDMEGRVLEETLRAEFRERFPRTRIPTYESVPLRQDSAPLSESMVAIEAEVMENLRALGYIGGAGDPTDDEPLAGSEAGGAETESLGQESMDTVTAHTNLAGVLLSRGELERAEVEILAALELLPRFVTARRQLFDLRVRQDRLDEALKVAGELIADGQTDDSRFLARVAETYYDAERSDEGIRLFRDGVARGRWELGVPLSRLLIHRGDMAGADRAARAVVAADPLNEAAMATVFRIAQGEGSLATTLPLLDRALERNPRSVMHLNWLAVVRESEGDMAGAERELRRALDVDPDHGAAMANLGAFYGRHGRADEAVTLLQRALRIEPGNLEARINLGTALGRLGRIDEAAAEFERAVELGTRDPGVYNILARIYGERGDVKAAADWLRRSLEVDPDQQQIRRLLEEIEAAQRDAGR